MDLLPQTEKEFTDPSYWKRFFEQCESSFEWYGSYEKLSSVLSKYMRPTDAILQVGCGNSDLAEQLHDNGYRNIFSIDTDAQVIAQQRRKQSDKRPSLKFEQCSATNTELPNGSVNVVVDKGTLDALLPSESSGKDEELVDAMFAELDRCLAPFGRYIVITLAQQHIIRRLADYFGTNRFMVRVQRCEQTTADFAMPVFAIVVTKLKMALAQQRPFEFVNSVDGPPEPLGTSVEKLQERICAAQQMNWFRHFISRGPVEETSVKICSSSDGAERFELIVVDDRSLRTILKYGAFIVPFGREKDWLYATPKGRAILRKNCELHRLVVVRLYRTQKYGSLEEIQRELNHFILDFMPRTCIGQRINFLSLGTMDVTESVAAGCSAISGKWTVEHVRIMERTFRRLVFLDSANLVQSEAEVKKDRKGKWHIDWSDVSCDHHRMMLAALEFLVLKGQQQNGKTKPIGLQPAMDAEVRFALLGLGGGILAKFVHDKFPKSKIVAVELDQDVVSIARRHFDFPEDHQSDRLQVRVCDALDFLHEISSDEAEDSKFDVLLVDLSGSADESVGLYCPPPEFVTEQTLDRMKNSLRSNGVLSLNMVTRDNSTADSVKHLMATIFPSVYTIKGEEDVNEVLLCPKYHLDVLLPDKKKGAAAGKKSKKYQNEQQQLNMEPWMAECVSWAKSCVKFEPNS